MYISKKPLLPLPIESRKVQIYQYLIIITEAFNAGAHGHGVDYYDDGSDAANCEYE
ncbi:hypothetical protein [Psychrobacter sp.]|uniref:hypothetical protein n=1 Tax=Psychrobacter sp. TaxID=56811 RepID=UPI0039C9E0D4